MSVGMLNGKVDGFNTTLAQESNLITFKACKMQNWEAPVLKEGRTIYKTPFILKDNADQSFLITHPFTFEHGQHCFHIKPWKMCYKEP